MRSEDRSQVYQKLRQLVLDQAPYSVVVDRRIAMYENVSKGDDAAQFGDLACDLWIDLSKLGERLADDLKLAFYGRAQQIVFDESLAGLSAHECLNRLRRLQRVPEIAPGSRCIEILAALLDARLQVGIAHRAQFDQIDLSAEQRLQLFL